MDDRIELPKSRISPEGWAQIREALSTNSSLKSFRFLQSELTDVVVPDLCTFLKKNKTVKYFRFDQSRFSDDGVRKVLQAFDNNTTLRFIEIRDCPLSDAVLPDICRVLTGNRTLQILQFYKSKFSDDGMKRILQSFLNNRTLTHLCVWNSVLSDVVVPDICEVLTENTVLVELQLKESKFSDDGMSHILRALLTNRMLTNFSIWKSTLTDVIVPDICQFVAENTMMKDLRLLFSRFSDDGMRRILQSLLKKMTVTDFKIWKSALTDAVVGDICGLFEDLHIQDFTLWEECIFTDERMPGLLNAFRNNQSLKKISIDAPLMDECLPSLTSVVGKRTNLLDIVTVQQRETPCLKLVKSEGTGPLYYHAWKGENDTKFLLAAQYLQEELTKWLESNRVASAITIKENKLVLFLPQEAAKPLKEALLQELKAIPTTFHDCYKIQVLDKPLELAHHSKCGPGSKLYMEAEDKAIYSSAGALLKASNGRLYLMSACHGARVHECYMEEPAEEGSDRILVGTCVVNEFKKNPALVDACLFEIQNTDLREECDPFLPEPMEKSALCGPYGRLIVDLADKPGEEASAWSHSTPVMKFGQASKLTEGELVYYDFSEPSSQIKGALVIEPVEEEGVFAKEGDSGSVIFMKSPQEGDSASDVTLYEALAVHCYELTNLKKHVKVSLAFQLDHAITIFEEKIGKKLQLMKTW